MLLWPGTGMLGPLPAIFQAVPLPAGMAPATSPSHREGCGPPQPGSTDFPNWGKKKKKKNGCGKEGPGRGMHFPCFLLGPDSSSSARQMEKDSQSMPCTLGWAPATGLAATGANWGRFPLVQNEWRGPRHPQPMREHLGYWGCEGPVPWVLWSGSAWHRHGGSGGRDVRWDFCACREQIPACVGGEGTVSGGGVPRTNACLSVTPQAPVCPSHLRQVMGLGELQPVGFMGACQDGGGSCCVGRGSLSLVGMRLCHSSSSWLCWDAAW